MYSQVPNKSDGGINVIRWQTCQKLIKVMMCNNSAVWPFPHVTFRNRVRFQNAQTIKYHSQRPVCMYPKMIHICRSVWLALVIGKTNTKCMANQISMSRLIIFNQFRSFSFIHIQIPYKITIKIQIVKINDLLIELCLPKDSRQNI